MPSVLIVSPFDMAPRLGSTLLWRRDIERVSLSNPGMAVEHARASLPNLVLVDADHHEGALALLRELRADPVARERAMVAVRASASTEHDTALRGAGANLVLCGDPVPFLWDQWLEELLSVPRRKEARLTVRLEVWARHGNGAPAPRSVGFTVNLSDRGMLLETSEPLTAGATLDLEIHLPGEEQTVHAVAQVVRDATAELTAFGIKLLRIEPEARQLLSAYVEGRAAS